ncbi:hypothetical protein J5893_02570 [bacterium]|nr:hypothetical protein [bacterium]
MYHFSYDRKALGALFDLFLQWYKEGKQLYILAGNHDWMGQFFVFDEGRKTFELFQSGIKFITKPLLETIDGEQVLFLPHMLEIHLEDYP